MSELSLLYFTHFKFNFDLNFWWSMIFNMAQTYIYGISIKKICVMKFQK